MKTQVASTLRAASFLALLGSSLQLASCTDTVEAAPPGNPQPVSERRAFPAAIGHGAGAVGGEQGRIIRVTNRRDSGPGSLRDCLEAQGKRVCVFAVGGVFRFTTKPPIIKNPYLTIAGQTAPGGSVVITHAGGSSARTPIVIKNTHDVIVRHVRVRLDRLSANRKSDDAFTIENSRDVIIDHVSASWASDELINGYGDNDRVTISNSIFSYGIPRHDKCALLASDPKGPQRLSFIGNVCAHNGDRNPDINFPPNSCVEVVNNILYNAQSQFAEVWEGFGGSPVSIVGNTFVGGPNTRSRAQGIARNTIGSRGTAEIYLWDNDFRGNFEHVSSFARAAQVERPPCAMTIQPQSATQAYEHVLERAGAWPRDAIDIRVISDVRNQSGKIIKKPGPIPPLSSGEPYSDIDEDGMDDGWEASHGSNPRLADAWADSDGDGVSNFENFLSYREDQLRRANGA
ncbi:MAG: pectate lyase [Pseudomonadota bacterium]